MVAFRSAEERIAIELQDTSSRCYGPLSQQRLNCSQAIGKVQRATKWRHTIAQGVSPGFNIDHDFSPEGPTYQARCVAHFGAKT